jgi:DNA polymerase-3 subunit alpha
VYLNCHSVFSFRYGTLRISQLLALAKQQEQKSLVLTDINNTSACLNFVREAELAGIKPLVGIDFRNGAKQQFVGIAKSNQGFEELNRYLSSFLHQSAAEQNRLTNFPKRAPEFKRAFVIYPFERFRHQFIRLKENEFIGISIEQLKHLPFSPWRGHQDKFVLLQTVTFQSKRDFNIHRLLRAIGNNCLLSKLAAKEVGKPKHQMYAGEVIDKALADFPKIKENTEYILSEAEVSFVYKGHQKSGTINHNVRTSPSYYGY